MMIVQEEVRRHETDLNKCLGAINSKIRDMEQKEQLEPSNQQQLEEQVLELVQQQDTQMEKLQKQQLEIQELQHQQEFQLQ